MASSYHVNVAIDILKIAEKIHKLALLHLSSLGSCNAYLNIGYVAGMFFDWLDCFYSGGLGANQNILGKLYMKLAMG